MTPKYSHARSCAQKRPYYFRGHAEAALLKMVHQLGLDVRDFDVYKCRFCPHWHVGHADKRTLTKGATT